MNGAPGGFTIIEVMIVLAISSAMVVLSSTIFLNTKNNTYFTQAVYDLRSQLQTIANDVSSQVVPGLQAYTCKPTTVSGGAVLPTLHSGSPIGENCIYIGQAVQVINGTGTKLYSYPVFGLRTVYSGGADTKATPTSIDQVTLNPATDTLTDAIIPELSSTYPVLNGVKTLWSKVGGSERDLIGIYNNVSESNTSGNEITTYAYNKAYNSIADVTTTYDTIKSCVRTNCGSPLTSLTPLGASAWQICITDDRQSALINYSMTATGASVNSAIKTSVNCT